MPHRAAPRPRDDAPSLYRVAPMDLTGTTCLVTGANRGIGAAIAVELSRRPVGRLLLGMRDPAGQSPPTASPRGAREIRPVAFDLSTPEDIERSWAALPAEDRELDLLVNNAGRMTGGLLEDQDVDDVYAMFQVNLLAVVHLTRLALPGMVARGRGKVVNNASISGYAFFPTASTYAASKAGVVAFSESLRRELEGSGVTVAHLVTPGVRTDMLAATEEVYGRHMDTSGWPSVEPSQWAAKAVAAIESDASLVRPPGRLEVARLASRGPASLIDAITRRSFSRQPRS